MTLALETEPVAAVAARISEQAAACVREVGRMRGRHDAARITAAASPSQLRAVRARRAYSSYLPGDVANELATLGLLTLAQLFAPNATGCWDTFIRHTTGMMLTAADRDLLATTGAGVDAVAAHLGELYAFALQQGWEDAICDAVMALVTSP